MDDLVSWVTEKAPEVPGDGTMWEKATRLPPPKGIGPNDWKVFLLIMEVDLMRAGLVPKGTIAGLTLPHETREDNENCCVNSFRAPASSNCGDERTHTFIDEAQGNGEAHHSTIYNEKTGHGDTRRVRFSEPERRAYMFVKDPREKSQGKSQKDNIGHCPTMRRMPRLVDKPGIREDGQGRTHTFIDESRKQPWRGT